MESCSMNLMSSFCSQDAFEIFPCCCMYQWFISFIPIHIRISYTLFIHSLNHLGFQFFWLLRVKLLWTLLYKSLCRHMLLFLLVQYIGVKFLSYMVKVCLILQETTNEFYKVVPVTLHPCQYLMFSRLILAITVGVKRQLICFFPGEW